MTISRTDNSQPYHEILPNGTMIDKITTYDEYLASDEMAKKRHVFEINEEDASDN